MKDKIMFVSTILVLGICVLVSWLLVPYVCAGLEMMILAASFLVNGLLFAFAICILLYFARTKGIRIFIMILGIITMFISSAVANPSRYISDGAYGKEGFIFDTHWSCCSIYNPNGTTLFMDRDKIFKAISPTGAVLVSMDIRTKYKEDSNREPENTIVYARVYDYDGNKLSEEEYDYNYDENFELNEDRIKYIKMRLRVDKNIYLRHQIN